MTQLRLRTFITALAVLAATLCASWIYAYGERFEPRLLFGALVFMGLIAAGEAFSARIDERFTISSTDVGLIAAVAVLGPVWTVLAALPADILVSRRNWLRMTYEVSHTVTIVFLSGTVFSLAADPLLTAYVRPSAELFYGVLVAGATLVASNVVLDNALLSIKYEQPFVQSLRKDAQPYLLSNALDVLVAGLGVLVLAAYGPASALILLVGALSSQMLINYAKGHRARANAMKDRVASLEAALATSNATFGTVMVQELGRKDGYTHRHAAATSVYAADLAGEMKLDGARIHRLRLAGLLHNIGMFGLPEELLLSAGKLNSVARYQIAEHPVRGQKVLGAVPEYEEVASWVRWHHERPDGRGYPDKLRGPWIPLEAKILAAAQAYAAMVLDGPRRPGMSPEEARRELGKGVDTQFDGVVVRAFLRILDTESEGYRMADDHRFVLPSAEPGGGPFARQLPDG